MTIFRVVFKQRKKSKAADEIVHKKYILSSDVYEFGPLLVGTSREKFLFLILFNLCKYISLNIYNLLKHEYILFKYV